MPDDLEVLLGVARCLLRLERLEDARPFIQELADRHHSAPAALLECGRFALKDMRPGDAERFLLRAVELDPNDPEIHFTLSLCLDQLDKPEEAKQHLAKFRLIEADLARMERLVAESVRTPNDPTPRREIGAICLRNGDTKEGLRWLNGVLDSHPNDRATHAILAEYFLSQGDLERAGYHGTRAK
jgi:Flp pilus assembly protein TadD